MIEQLVKEQDKWHRRYNDAIIEIAKLSAINRNLEDAIRILIRERDCAIDDMRYMTFNRVGKIPKSMCDTCANDKGECLRFYLDGEEVGCVWIWRGVPHDRNNQRRCL